MLLPVAAPLHGYSNPLLDDMIFRLAFGGAKVPEVLEKMAYIFGLLHIDTTEDELREHIISVLAENQPKADEKKPTHLRVEEYVTFVTSGGDLSQSVTFSLQDCYNSLNLQSSAEKAGCRMVIKRLCDKGQIEPAGSKSGLYRVVNTEDRSIDLGDLSDLKGEMRIGFPLNVHKFIKVMPHTVYIIAGETDSGKSAYLLNFAKMNSQLHKVHYHSSEMGKAEFLDRLQYFWSDAHLNTNMKFYERSNDFANAIKRFPNDVHIIDYMQMFDNFYLMAEYIDKIGKALNNGLAFIAIQKPKGRDEGLGGERTKDLSRLYLSLSPGKLKIVKAKNWKDPKENPNGREICFKLVKGCEFHNQGDWSKP
jgi:hypothetical protein